MTSHCITWHDTTQAITSHQMTWPSHDLTPQQTSRHQNTSLQSTKHHHHGTAEGSFTAKKWFGHRAGRSPCAHSIGKFFLCYIVLFLLETSAPGLSGYYWYTVAPRLNKSIFASSDRRSMRSQNVYYYLCSSKFMSIFDAWIVWVFSCIVHGCSPISEPILPLRSS